MQKVVQCINIMNECLGKCFSYLIWIGILMLAWEVVSRYVFNAPTIWAHGWSQRLFGSYFVLIGAYTLLMKGHVRIDLITSRLKSTTNAILDLVCYAFVIFWGVCVIQAGWGFFQRSWQMREVDEMALAHPVYPFKFIMLLGLALIVLQAFSMFCGTIISMARGSDKNES